MDAFRLDTAVYVDPVFLKTVQQVARRPYFVYLTPGSQAVSPPTKSMWWRVFGSPSPSKSRGIGSLRAKI